MAPGTDRASAEGTLQASVDKLTTEINKLEPKCNELIDKINGCLRDASFVSPVAAYLYSRKIAGKLDEMWEFVKKVNEEIGKYIGASLPVFSLIDRGFRWTDEVLPEFSGTVGIARDIRPNALQAWGAGQAGRAYMEKRWGQADALKGTTNVIKDTGQWLINVAALNTKFLVDITEPIIELIEAIIEASAEFVTVIGAPLAIDTVADAIAKALTAVLKIAKEAAIHVAESMQALNEAKVIVNNNDAFPGGKWPQAVNR
jgi:hypothetical protein